MVENVDITGVNKAALLMELYNNAETIGYGSMHAKRKDMSLKEAQQIVKKKQKNNEQLRFDYIKGRIIKADITGDSVNSYAYNRDNGYEALERIVQRVKDNPPVAPVKTDFEAMMDEVLSIPRNLVKKVSTIFSGPKN